MQKCFLLEATPCSRTLSRPRWRGKGSCADAALGPGSVLTGCVTGTKLLGLSEPAVFSFIPEILIEHFQHARPFPKPQGYSKEQIDLKGFHLGRRDRQTMNK